MTKRHDKNNPSDKELVAYLDGELAPDVHAWVAQRIASDHQLQRRLLLLASGNRPFRDAFTPLLDQAPRTKLEAMLASLPVPKSSLKASTLQVREWSGRIRAAAVSLLLFVAGVGSGWFMPTLSQYVREQTSTKSTADEDDWRQAVAEYMALYTSGTLASIPDNAQVREQELVSVGSKLRITLSPQAIALPDLSFKRAQLLEYDRRPLGQIIYLDPESGPTALCIITDGSPDIDQRTEQRQGLNIVYWSRHGHSFMLIGRAAIPRLQRLVSDLSVRLM